MVARDKFISFDVYSSVMRVIKLGLDSLPTMDAVDSFFESISDGFQTGGMMDDHSVIEGDTMIFLHGGRMVRKGRAASGVDDKGILWIGELVQPRKMMRLSEFQDLLFRAAGVAVNLATDKWYHILEDDAIKALWNRI
jgi:hypothetical protein